MQKVKVILFCQASEGNGDSLYGVNGAMHRTLRERAGVEIEYINYGGHLTGEKRKNFIVEAQSADIVLLDAWTHAETGNHGRVKDSQEAMFDIAKLISTRGTALIIFAELMEGIDKVAVHRVARPIRSWYDDAVVRGIKTAHALKNRDGRKVILVIDDKEANLTAAEKQLESFGVVITETSYIRGMRMIADIHPDVVLSDLMFPAESDNQGMESIHNFVGKEMDMGVYLVFKAIEQNISRICLVSDTNHHAHPAGHVAEMFKDINLSVKFFCGYNCPMLQEGNDWVKNWAAVLSE